MLEVGVSWGTPLTTEETKTHFGMWCIMNSPLLIGCNIKNLSTTNLNLLKNKELIALNQDTLYQQAYLAAKINGCYIMVKDIEKANDTKRAFAIYNPNDAEKTVTLKFSDIDLADSVALRDVFAKKDLGKFYETYEVTVPKHGTRIYVAEAETRLERTRYEAETGYGSAYSEIEWNVCQYAEASFCSGGYKAGYLGQSEKNDLQWRNVYSKEGGKYYLTIAYISGESRNITLSVNGKKINTYSVNSGGWDKVAKKKVSITLEPGNNVIRLSNASGWMPDFDYIEVTPNVSTSIDNVQVSTSDEGQGQHLYDLQGREVKTDQARDIVISNNHKRILK